MKKLFVLVLASLLCLSMAACGGTNSSDDPHDVSPVLSATAAPSPAAAMTSMCWYASILTALTSIWMRKPKPYTVM